MVFSKHEITEYIIKKAGELGAVLAGVADVELLKKSSYLKIFG